MRGFFAFQLYKKPFGHARDHQKHDRGKNCERNAQLQPERKIDLVLMQPHNYGQQNQHNGIG